MQPGNEIISQDCCMEFDKRELPICSPISVWTILQNIWPFRYYRRKQILHRKEGEKMKGESAPSRWKSLLGRLLYQENSVSFFLHRHLISSGRLDVRNGIGKTVVTWRTQFSFSRRYAVYASTPPPGAGSIEVRPASTLTPVKWGPRKQRGWKKHWILFFLRVTTACGCSIYRRWQVARA